MPELQKKARNLLKTLAEITLLRKNEDTIELYKKYFQNSTSFLVAKIRGEIEFIPENLLAYYDDKPEEDLRKELIAIFEPPVSNPKLDKRLVIFYRRHKLKREVIPKTSKIIYFLKPKEVKDDADIRKKKDHDVPFFSVNAIDEINEYAGQAYMASDPHLREIGTKFRKELVEPTNYWMSLLDIQGFTGENERYWQVAGTFKTFTRFKFYREGYEDSGIFFSFGFDLLKNAIYYNLDCQRTGSSKIPNSKILKFDYFIDGYGARKNKIKARKFDELNWDLLCEITTDFINQYKGLYDDSQKYVWGKEIDINKVKNRLLEIPDYKSALTVSNDFPDEKSSDKQKINRKGMLLIIDYEKKLLELQGKNDLSKKVKMLGDNSSGYDILSYDTNGSEKWIKAIILQGSIVSSFHISDAVIKESRLRSKNSYLFMVFSYKKSRNSGRLLIRKGDFKKFLKLKPSDYEAVLK